MDICLITDHELFMTGNNLKDLHTLMTIPKFYRVKRKSQTFGPSITVVLITFSGPLKFITPVRYRFPIV